MYQSDWPKWFLLKGVCKLLALHRHAVVRQHTHFFFSLLIEPNPTSSITGRHSTKTTVSIGSSWHLFKERLWRSPAMTGTGSLRGGLTTRAEHRQETFFWFGFFFSSSLPSLHADDITLQSAFPSSNSSRRNIPATHNQNYQAPSPRRQPTPPLKWKPKPRAFSPCEEGADDEAASVPGRRTRCVAREA